MALTQQTLKDLLEYEPSTGIFYWKSNTSSRNVIGKPAGYCKGYVFIRIHKKLHYAHRLAFLYMTGNYPADQVDHINGVPSDNRWENLREVSPLENRRNAARSKNNTSGVTGITWDKRKNFWYVRITLNRINKFIGYFEHLEDAKQARKQAEIDYGFHQNHGRNQA